MPGYLDKYDFLFALIALIVSVHIVGMINHRECAVTVNEISKRCDLPVDVQNFRIRDDELLAAKNLADMENKWVPFKARFNINDNKLSMKMVRQHSTMNMSSDWRMDLQTNAKGNQWFTVMGRWVGKPLSFEFDQKFFMVNEDTKPVAREESWFNFKSRTWLGRKVLKQIDLYAVPERTVTSYSELEMTHAYNEFPKLEQNLIGKIGVKDTAIPDEQTADRTRKSPMVLLPVHTQFPKYQDYRTENTETEATASLEDRVEDDRAADRTRQGVIELQPMNSELLKYQDYKMENTETEATASLEDCVKEKRKTDMTKQGVIELQPLNSELPKYENYMKKHTETEATASLEDHDEEQPAEITSQSETNGPTTLTDHLKVEQKPTAESETEAAISKGSHVKGAQQARKFNQKEEENMNDNPRKPAPSDVKPKVTAKAERHAKVHLQPKCPRFSEYNASNVVKNTAVCLPDELSMDECPSDVNETSTDTASNGVNLDQGQTYEEQSLEPDMGLVDCTWYSPTQVLFGAAAVTMVSVTVATTYVMMMRPQYFWTS